MSEGIKWGEDLERDCREMKRLESWGLYPRGYHEMNCTIHTPRFTGEERARVWVLDLNGRMKEMLNEGSAAEAAEDFPNMIHFFASIVVE